MPLAQSRLASEWLGNDLGVQGRDLSEKTDFSAWTTGPFSGSSYPPEEMTVFPGRSGFGKDGAHEKSHQTVLYLRHQAEIRIILEQVDHFEFIPCPVEIGDFPGCKELFSQVKHRARSSISIFRMATAYRRLRVEGSSSLEITFKVRQFLLEIGFHLLDNIIFHLPNPLTGDAVAIPHFLEGEGFV